MRIPSSGSMTPSLADFRPNAQKSTTGKILTSSSTPPVLTMRMIRICGRLRPSDDPVGLPVIP